jgi:hypothetical protein
MNMSETEKKLLDRLLKEKTTRFNELAKELALSDEEIGDYDTKSESGLDAGINSLRIMRGRKNAWDEAIPTKEKGFFHPAGKRIQNAKPAPLKGDETPPQGPRRFNMAQLADSRLEPDLPTDLEEGNSEGTIMRVYGYMGYDGVQRYNSDGYKV